MKKYLLLPILILLAHSGGSLFAQVGMTSNNPAPSAALDLRAPVANKGLLLPQVSLTSLTGSNPVSAAGTADAGLLVYNTNAGITGGTGYYYWDGAQWIKLAVGTGTLSDNLGNHTATLALDMKTYNVNNVNKLSTQTTSIAKGSNGLPAIAGTMLTAGDATGNSNWTPPPPNPRTFFWKVAGGNGTYYSIVKPAASMPWPDFADSTYTAPADGTLEVSLIMYPTTTQSLNDNSSLLGGLRELQYSVGSIALQPMANNVAVPNSAVTTPFTTYMYIFVQDAAGNWAYVTGHRQVVYLTTTFPVTKGKVYSFKITVAGEAQQPGSLESTHNQLTFKSTATPDGGTLPNRCWHVMSGVFYPNP